MPKAKAQTLKRGPLNSEEKGFIAFNADKMSAVDIARKLLRTTDTISRYIRVEMPAQAAIDKGNQQGLADRAGLRGSQKWKRLKEEFSAHELLFFEEEYLKLVSQFRNDVLPSEETQIFDSIRVDLLKSRNLVERNKTRADLARLQEEQKEILLRLDEPEPDDRDRLRELDRLISSYRDTERGMGAEYGKMQERSDALLKSLNSTRDQRKRELNNDKGTVLMLIKMLQDEETRAAEGRLTGLAKMAATREYRRLGSLHTYQDGEADRPILSPETLAMEEEVATVTEGGEDGR